MYPQSAVKGLDKMHFEEKQNLDRQTNNQIRKADVKITFLKHNFEVGAWSQVNCVNSLKNTIT